MTRLVCGKLVQVSAASVVEKIKRLLHPGFATIARPRHIFNTLDIEEEEEGGGAEGQHDEEEEKEEEEKEEEEKEEK